MQEVWAPVNAAEKMSSSVCQGRSDPLTPVEPRRLTNAIV